MHITFTEQVVLQMNPLSYNFTRYKGLLELQVRGPMNPNSGDELLDPESQIMSGDDVDELRELLKAGAIDIVDSD